MKRPLKTRVWFYKPWLYWHGWEDLIPFSRGGDEFEWHTVVIGWGFTGKVIIATRKCPLTGKCEGLKDSYEEYDMTYPEWPVDGYGFNHLTGLDKDGNKLWE